MTISIVFSARLVTARRVEGIHSLRRRIGCGNDSAPHSIDRPAPLGGVKQSIKTTSHFHQFVACGRGAGNQSGPSLRPRKLGEAVQRRKRRLLAVGWFLSVATDLAQLPVASHDFVQQLVINRMQLDVR